MDKKKSKELSDSVKARKMVKEITKGLKSSVNYKFKDDIKEEELMDALIEFMRLVVVANKQGKKDEYNEKDVTYTDIIRDFLSLQHISLKDGQLSDLGISREDFFEIEMPTL